MTTQTRGRTGDGSLVSLSLKGWRRRGQSGDPAGTGITKSPFPGQLSGNWAATKVLQG